MTDENLPEQINPHRPLAPLPGEPPESVEMLRFYAEEGVRRSAASVGRRFKQNPRRVSALIKEWAWDQRVGMWIVEEGRRADLQMQEIRATAARDCYMGIDEVIAEAWAEWKRQGEAGVKIRNSDLLRIILNAIADKRKQLGLDAPRELVATINMDARVEEILAARFAEIAERIKDPNIIDLIEQVLLGEVVDAEFTTTSTKRELPSSDDGEDHEYNEQSDEDRD